MLIAGALPPPHKPIDFDPALVEKSGRHPARPRRIIAILQGLGFVVEEHGATLQVVPPSWRHDVDGPADLVEEVVRIHGLTEVPSVALDRAQRRGQAGADGRPSAGPHRARELAARGFNECVSFSFIARDQAKLFGGGDDARQLANPIASDLDALRPSVLPSLLAAASRNAARGFADLQLFEIGAAFHSGMPEAQTTKAAAIRTGNASDWRNPAKPPAFWQGRHAGGAGSHERRAMTAPITPARRPGFTPAAAAPSPWAPKCSPISASCIPKSWLPSTSRARRRRSR